MSYLKYPKIKTVVSFPARRDSFVRIRYLNQIAFLANLAIYGDEKPYCLHTSDSAGDYLDGVQIPNVEWNTRPMTMTVYNMRGKEPSAWKRLAFAYDTRVGRYTIHKRNC